MKTFLTGAGAVLAVLSLATTAAAQATRTWVSGEGDDVNPCSRSAPCKTFAGAISKTATGGEINAMDPGGFGAITITKSITIDGRGTMASILAAGSNGVNVNGANIVVTLRNLSINGVGTGVIGVNITNAKHVNIEHCDIFGFGAGTGRGVYVNTTTSTNLHITDSRITNNLDAGVFLGFGNAMILGSSLIGNGGPGLEVNASAAGATSVAMISNSTLAFNETSIEANSGGIARMTHLDIFANTGPSWRIGATGTIETHVDNRIRGNAGAGTLTPITFP
jgi:hypothetical protein